MFDATAQILTEHAVTIPAFLFGLWIVSRFLLARRSTVDTLVRYVGGAAALPLFLALFLAEFTDYWLWQRIARTLVDVESAALAFLAALVDAAFAAWLRLFLLAVGGVWSALRDAVAPVASTVTESSFLALLFGFEFFAGAVLIYALYYSSRGDGVNDWLKSAGVILLLSGVFSTLVRVETSTPSGSAFASGVLAATLGLTAGVSSSVLLLRPNFDPDREVSESRAGGTDESTAASRLRGAFDGAVTRLTRMLSNQEK